MVKHKISLFYELVAVFMKATTYIVVGYIILSFSRPLKEEKMADVKNGK